MPGILSWIALGVRLHFGAVPVVFAEVIVAGVASSQLDPALKGMVLIEGLNRAARHAGDASLAARTRKAPRLANIGSRANPGWLSALDITRVTEGLKKNRFALYMRQPSRFHPTVIMPSYWPDGQATLTPEYRW